MLVNINKQMRLEHLPNEILWQIFLCNMKIVDSPVKVLSIISLVCKHWYQLASNKTLLNTALVLSTSVRMEALAFQLQQDFFEINHQISGRILKKLNGLFEYIANNSTDFQLSILTDLIKLLNKVKPDWEDSLLNNNFSRSIVEYPQLNEILRKPEFSQLCGELDYKLRFPTLNSIAENLVYERAEVSLTRLLVVKQLLKLTKLHLKSSHENSNNVILPENIIELCKDQFSRILHEKLSRSFVDFKETSGFSRADKGMIILSVIYPLMIILNLNKGWANTMGTMFVFFSLLRTCWMFGANFITKGEMSIKNSRYRENIDEEFKFFKKIKIQLIERKIDTIEECENYPYKLKSA